MSWENAVTSRVPDRSSQLLHGAMPTRHSEKFTTALVRPNQGHGPEVLLPLENRPHDPIDRARRQITRIGQDGRDAERRDLLIQRGIGPSRNGRRRVVGVLAINLADRLGIARGQRTSSLP